MSVMGSPANITLDNGDVMKALPLGNIGSANGTDAVSTANRPGYTNMRNGGHARRARKHIPAPWMAGVDASLGALQNNAPQPAGIVAGLEVIWPHACIDIVGSDTILHTVARGSGDGDYDPIYYWRGDINDLGDVVHAGVHRQHRHHQPGGRGRSQLRRSGDRVHEVHQHGLHGGLAQNYDDVIVRKSAIGGGAPGADDLRAASGHPRTGSWRTRTWPRCMTTTARCMCPVQHSRLARLTAPEPWLCSIRR